MPACDAAAGELMRRPGEIPTAAPRSLLGDGLSRPADSASARSCCSRRLLSAALLSSFALSMVHGWSQHDDLSFII